MKRENPEDQDSAWQKIVDNYGERAEIEAVDESPVEPAPAPHEDEDTDGHDELSSLFDDAEGFVPDAPPPIPMPPPDRLLAWLGVFGSPTVLLVFLVFGLPMPSLLSWILVGGFVFGFLYLVFKMPPSPRDPWDDGAVV